MRANISAFRAFVRFVLVWICRFPFPLGVWEGLWFVIMALPGLFPYLFFHSTDRSVGGPGVSFTICCFVVYSTRRFVLCLTLCFFCSCVFSDLLALRLPRLGKRELILVLFVRLFDLCLFRFVDFVFLSGSEKGCGL